MSRKYQARSNRFGIEVRQGDVANVHHPRGGSCTGVVTRIEKEEGQGPRVQLDSGFTAALDDVFAVRGLTNFAALSGFALENALQSEAREAEESASWLYDLQAVHLAARTALAERRLGLDAFQAVAATCSLVQDRHNKAHGL